MSKRVSILLVLVLAGCSAFSRQEIRSEKDFLAMQQSFITSLDDAMARFVHNVPEIENKKQACVTRMKEIYDAVLAVPAEQRTFANTMQPLDAVTGFLGEALGAIDFVNMLYPDATMHEAATNATNELRKVNEELFSGNKKIYLALVAYLEHGHIKDRLSKEQQYLLDETMAFYKRRGMHLSDEALIKLSALKNEIDGLEKEFSLNIDGDKSSITATRAQLAGMNETVINALEKKDDDCYILRCDYPTASEVQGYCADADTRKRFFEAFGNRAYPANMVVLDKMLNLRDQFAKLLGFDSFAAYEISGEMAKSPERVASFLQQLVNKATAKAGQEVALMKQDLPAGVALDKEGRFNPWDYSYVCSQYKKNHLKVDQREIAEYFPVDKALQGMLNIYQKLLSLSFTLLKPAWAWHEDVQVLEVKNAKTGLLFGYIVLDLYPRPGKYSHACCGMVVSSVHNQKAAVFGGREPGLAVVVANFPRATADKPALFKHADVETFFHEFGHAMHCMMAATALYSHAGYQTKTDFVELPSQIFEEWLYDRDLLKSISSHYKTGEPLPDHLIDALIALKQFDSGQVVLGQVRYAQLSLRYHLAGQNKDTDAIRLELGEQLLPHIAPSYTTHFQANFGHLGGYSSRYYGYLWSQVYALDVFYQLRPRGLVNPATGDWFVAEILGKGGSKDPNEMLKSFLGREPSIDAFFEDLGLH